MKLSHFPGKDATPQFLWPQHLHFAPLCPPHPTTLLPLPPPVQCSRWASSIHTTWGPVGNQKLGPVRVQWSQNPQFSGTPGDSCAELLWRTKGGALPGDWNSPELSVTVEMRIRPGTLSPEPSPTSGSVPGPGSQLTGKASLRHQLNQEPARFCPGSRVEWGTDFIVTHAGVPGSGPPLTGAGKWVSPSLSLRNSPAKNGNNHAHLAHSMGRQRECSPMPSRMLFAHSVFIRKIILSFYKYCQQVFFQTRKILCSLQSRMWSKSLINSFNKYLFSICTVLKSVLKSRAITLLTKSKLWFFQ